MTSLIPWFERRFSFDSPPEAYPRLLMRLRGAPGRMKELTQHLSQPVLTRQPSGKWSVQENIGHLLDLEPLWDARLTDFLEGRDALTPTDLENRKTHQARHNGTPPGILLSAFQRARKKLVARMESLEPTAFARSARHPRLGTPMRLVDMLEFIAEHDDHHIGRVRELIHESGSA